ncbi:conserved protein of unknown function (plasmid) [Caballeronia sp. S22]
MTPDAQAIVFVFVWAGICFMGLSAYAQSRWLQ